MSNKLTTRLHVESTMLRTQERLLKGYCNGKPRFWIGDAVVDPALAREMIADGVLEPVGDALWVDNSQTYKLNY